NATAAATTLNGHKAYGVYVAPGTGYRNDSTSGIATGDQAQGMYAIFDGTHYNGGCCFDYGNAETSNNDTGNGHMEAIYFGNIKGSAGTFYEGVMTSGYPSNATENSVQGSITAAGYGK